MDKKAKSKKKKFLGKYTPQQIVKKLWVAFGCVIALIIILFTCIATGIVGYMPDVEELENPIDKYASQIYSSDAVLLGTYSQAKNNRIYSNYSDLSPYLVQALVATEDARFYSHSGVDAYALTRAVVKTVILQQSSGGGGSTITQQLAKQLYSPPAENWMVRVFLRKPIEWVIAAKLERYYTKDEIINLYLNQFDFLNNAVGIQSAAQVYFNKTPKDLKIEEAATLIGMCKNPSYFNPKRQPERTKGRRDVVLDRSKYNIKYLLCTYLINQPLLPTSYIVCTYVTSSHIVDSLAHYAGQLSIIYLNKRPECSANGSSAHKVLIEFHARAYRVSE